MGVATLEEKIKDLPNELKLKVEGYVDGLLEEAKTHLSGAGLKERQFGGLKGYFGKMSDDFDEPLEDFKDYM